MLQRITPTLVQSIAHPYTVESLITAYPSLLNFFQCLVVLGENVGNGTNSSSFRDGEGFNNRILVIRSIHSTNTNNGCPGINSPLGLFRRTNIHNHLQSKCLGILDKLRHLLTTHHTIRHRNSLGTRIRSLRNLNLIHNQITRNHRQRSRYIPLRLTLLLDHGHDIIVRTSTSTIIREDCHGGSTEFAKYGRKKVWGEDFGYESTTLQFTFVFGDDCDGSLAFC
mmetsp:Transcript_23170/g.50174  ORF Transcript_23170/g.50174 Transcript_23170/m.50174 type:complete len:224 (-) Transcript_23170:352-1023(-)